MFTGLVFSLILFAAFIRIESARGGNAAAAQAATTPVPVDAESIGGNVTSSKGPEAGVWVIAETSQTSTKFRKIVVTDEQGRYLLPQLPKANYKIWVRGYGLVDSEPVDAAPGKTLNLAAVIAPNERAAAQYYPADYWYSLAQVPPASDFPGTGPQGNGINPNMKTQSDWVWQMKAGCETCHQIGDKATRELEPQLGTFPSSLAAWDHRVQVGQDGDGMNSSMNNYGRPRGLGMLADWTDRIAKGELPPAPSRPEGIERNIVLTSWEWGASSTFVHDELSTDKRHPTVNANGMIYGVDWGNDKLLMLDPVEHTASSIAVPVMDKDIPSAKTQSMPQPSPYWSDQLYWFDQAIPTNMAIDSKGRLWMPARFRKPEDQPAFCKEGSTHPSAQMQPIPRGWREMEYYDPKTRKFTMVNTCFDNHHVTISDDDVVYGSGSRTGNIGWVDIKVLDQTGSVEKAQGWCGGYFDINGNGKYDPDVDKKVVIFG